MSARLAMWATAAVRGFVAFDDVLDVVCEGRPHLVLGLPAVGSTGRPPRDLPDWPSTSTPAADTSSATRLAGVLIEWRRRRSDVRLVLPVAGDVRGVPTARRFLAAALEAGQGVYGGGIGLVPTTVAAGPSSAPPTTRWQAFDVDDPETDPLQINDAEHDLARAVRETAALLREAQLGGVRGADPGQIDRLRRIGEDFRFATGFAPRAAALVTQAERLDAMLDLAERDSVGGAIDRGGISVRADALRGLRATVRRARLAGYNGGYEAGFTDGTSVGRRTTDDAARDRATSE